MVLYLDPLRQAWESKNIEVSTTAAFLDPTQLHKKHVGAHSYLFVCLHTYTCDFRCWVLAFMCNLVTQSSSESIIFRKTQQPCVGWREQQAIRARLNQSRPCEVERLQPMR